MCKESFKHRIGIVVLIPFVVLLLLAGSVPLLAQGGGAGAARADTGSAKAIDGQVRVFGGNLPDQRLEVRLELHGQLVERAYTDGKGSFLFTGLGPNTYTLTIDEEGFNPVSESVRISADQRRPQNVVLVLRPVGSGPTLAEMAADLPDDARKSFEKGMKEAGDGKPDKALSHFVKVMESAPDFQPAYAQAGLQYMAKQDLEGAEKVLKKATELNPKDADSFFNLGNVYIMAQKFSEAERALRDGLTMAPESPYGLYLFGTSMAMTGRLADAEQALLKAVEVDSGMAPARFTLIGVYINQRKDQQALEQMRSFVKDFPDDPRTPVVKENLAKMEEWLKSQPQ